MPQSDRNPLPILVDTHAHLALSPMAEDPESCIARAAAQGVRRLITVGIDAENSEASVRIARRFPEVYATVGFHPHGAAAVDDRKLQRIRSLAKDPRVVGYGEIGLDFYWNHSPQDCQQAVFKEQLSLAQKLEKPLVIHLREAYALGLDLLEKAGPFPAGGVIHCFSGTPTDARRALDLGFYLSIPGTVTYKKNEPLREIVSGLPADRLLLETDCPFLAPVPHRGKSNEPALIIHTAREVARVRGEKLTDLSRTTTDNACSLFRLPPIRETDPAE